MRTSLLIAILSLSTSVFTSCKKESETENGENSESPRIINYSKLKSPTSNTTYIIGDLIPFEISSEKKVDSIILEYRDQEVMFKELIFEWASNTVRTGNQRLKLTVHLEGKKETHYPRLKFLSDVTPEQFTYNVTQTFPHNPDAYTQGLFFKEDTLYESTGSRGKSRLMKVNLRNANIYQSISLDSKYFGEGSTFWKDNIYMLTWTSQTGFIFDTNLNQKGTFRFPFAEGWGLATMGDTLVASDGTENLHFLNPQDLSEFDKLEVYNDQEKVVALNELEIINNLIYANIYQEEKIVVIDPKTGKILREIDLSGLLSENEAANADVLNGIAHNPSNNKTYVTGKLWPKLFEVTFIKK